MHIIAYFLCSHFKPILMRCNRLYWIHIFSNLPYSYSILILLLFLLCISGQSGCKNVYWWWQRVALLLLQRPRLHFIRYRQVRHRSEELDILLGSAHQNCFLLLPFLSLFLHLFLHVFLVSFPLSFSYPLITLLRLLFISASLLFFLLITPFSTTYLIFNLITLHLISCFPHLSPHHRGVAYSVKAYQIPLGSRIAKGVPLPQVLPISSEEQVHWRHYMNSNSFWILSKIENWETLNLYCIRGIIAGIVYSYQYINTHLWGRSYPDFVKLTKLIQSLCR